MALGMAPSLGHTFTDSISGEEAADKSVKNYEKKKYSAVKLFQDVLSLG